MTLTAALLATGCTPNFDPPSASAAEPAAAPAAAQHTAEATMSEAATVLARRVTESHPPLEEATADEILEETNDQAEQDDDEDSPAAGSARREQLEAWSESLTQAHEADQERAVLEEEQQLREEAEARRQAEAEAEQEAQRQAEAEQEAEAEEEADEQVEEPPAQATPPEPPAQTESPSFDGDLNTYLGQLAGAHPGQISISLTEIGGQGRRGSSGGGDSYVTASTYKLLVAYSILQRVESGTMSWDDHVLPGRDLSQCFQDMISLSDNPCPEKIGPEIGWANIYSDAAGLGVSNTRGGQGGILTTPNDLTSFMTSLAAGNMAISGASQDRLRNALAANIHRQGIPAGSSGQVLNKPGFINGNLHDTAIVRHPSGTYVLTIMSQGSSWDAIAAITRDIEHALYG